MRDRRLLADGVGRPRKARSLPRADQASSFTEGQFFKEILGAATISRLRNHQKVTAIALPRRLREMKALEIKAAGQTLTSTAYFPTGGRGGPGITMATTDFGSALTAAFQGGTVAHLSGGTYTITAPIVIHVTQTMQGPVGIDGGGATLVSQVGNGQPLIQIIVDPGVDFRYLTLSNFTIEGNGHEGDGIQLVANSNNGWLYNWTINNVTVEHVGGYGLDAIGN